MLEVSKLGAVPRAVERRLNLAGTSLLDLRATLRVEDRLLVACARNQLTSEMALQIKDLLHEPIDWQYLYRKAHHHRVAPLLYSTLSSFERAGVPNDVLGNLRNSFEDNVRDNLFRTGEMLKFLRVFEAKGIPAVPFKGPTLAVQAFGHLGLRQYGDLDILVRKRDVPKARDLLLAHGYRLAVPLTLMKRVILKLAPGKDVIFVKDENRVVIELHWRLTDKYFDLPLDMKSLWRRLVPMSLGGTTVKTLPLEDLILYLCMHGARHSWERLAWICDLAELVRVNPQMDWNSLMNRAKILGSERVLALGLLLASDVLGLILPTELSARVQSDPKVRLAAMRVRELLFQGENDLDISYLYRHHLLMRERFPDRVSLYVHYSRRYLRLMFRPSALDREHSSLPESLSFLLFVVRPIRLAAKYGLPTLKTLSKRFRSRY
jgi:hypothetical protein